MFKKIFIALCVIIVAFVIIVSLQSADFRIVRSAVISAPPAPVFAQVNDLHQWRAWSPYEKLDPNLKRTYEGSAAGVGATYAWAGNNDVGEGRMTIVESHPSDLLRMKLEFLKPFASTNSAEFTFQPENNQTKVTWSMAGKKNFVSKAICMFLDMDKMVGGQFEEGLANLKSLSEGAGKK